MNSHFHYFDGFILRILCSIILFCGIISANHFLSNETQKNALVQAIAYTGRSDFITETFGFDKNGTFLIRLQNKIHAVFDYFFD